MITSTGTAPTLRAGSGSGAVLNPGLARGPGPAVEDGPVRIGLLAVAGWLVAAVLTVGVSWSAVSVVRTAVAPPPVVAGALPSPDETPGDTPSRTATRPATPTSSAIPPASAGAPASGGGQGGTVTVRCVDGVPRLLNVTPQQGYGSRVDDPGEVEFESDDHRTEVTVTCTGGTARIDVEEKSGRGGGSVRGGGGDDD
jgi:hypothetical protein